ncbi:MAG: amidase [Bacillota bacterium]|nr:amidase [Bacillota bacterium]
MRVIGSDRVIYAFSPKNEPVDWVDLNEEFWMELRDCYSGQIKTEKDLRPNIDTSIMDAATGPVGIRGVRHGDVIAVTIHEIELAPQGVMVTAPGLGPLGEFIREPNTKIIPVRQGLAYFSDQIQLPLTPMVGVLGVAPAEGEIHCVVPGKHGGNLDTKDITAGNKVYFPVFVDGANLAAGDLHACMGDGELSGTGIEIAGRIRLEVCKVPGLYLHGPVVETETAFMVLASAETFSQAAQEAISFGVELLQRSLSLDFPDAYRLLSATSDLRVSQIVNPLLTVRVAIPKKILPALI